MWSPDRLRIRAAAAGLAAGAALAADAAPASDALVDTVKTPRVTATLAPALSVAAPGATVPMVLHQRIIDGWHTYWENPGDSGQRIAIDWQLPDGVTAGELRYPVPEAIPVGPMMNYGYAGEAAVLAELAISADWPAGRPVPVRARATWLVCEQICIPEDADFALTLPTAAEPVPLQSTRALFDQALAALPQPAPWPVSVREDGDTLVIAINAALDPTTARDAYFFPRHWGHVNHAAEQRIRVTSGSVELILEKGDIPPGELLDGVLALGGAARTGYLISASLGAAAESKTAADGGAPADIVAEGYDPARLDAILAGGGAVFLNVTAEWCVICQVNERVALSGEGFKRALGERGITYMKGDWTDRDPELTSLLKRFGRDGVPLYVIFPRGGGEPRVLPQVLTESIVSEALAAS